MLERSATTPAVAAYDQDPSLLLLLLQELDEAARRRMPKQLYIPLPCGEARRQLILRQLGPGAKVAADLSPSDLDKVRQHFPAGPSQ